MSAGTRTVAAMVGLVGLALAVFGSASAHHLDAHPAASSLDLTNLALGDGRVTTSGPRRGWVYSCGMGMGGPSAPSGPWISGSHWDLTQKPTVDGAVDWPNAYLRVRRAGSQRTLTGNGLPTHLTGSFPIAQSDDAYQFDRNPNAISPQMLDVTITAKPKRTASASCVPGGAIGVLRTGAVLFNALDAASKDAAAHEIQDRCGGHPQRSGQYHYHALPTCLATGSRKKHSRRIGWAFDGFPIFGPRGAHGKYMRNSDLDACHGHTHRITTDGKRRRLYHYHATLEYPYTLACFRGTPVRVGGGPPGMP